MKSTYEPSNPPSTPLGDLVRKLAAAGCSLEQIAIACDAVTFASRDASRSKSKSAERSKRYRERQAEKRHVTRHVSLFLTKKDSKNLSVKQNRKTVVVERGERLPAGWEPSAKHHDEAAKLGLDLADMARDMRLWAEANGHRAVGRKSNWNSAFSGWMRREAARGKSNESNREKYSVSRAIARNHENGIGFGPRPSLVRPPSGELDLLLSPGRRAES